ncbi:MAG: ATP-binding protein [Clostridia bacterium]|nr:ATP-binding protein [Clostridia bacterium]
MKLLKVKASNFKNCVDDFEIDFIAKSKKTIEDKEYELQEIADGLFVFNTMAFVGKNASGKTTAVELLNCCYSILESFSYEPDNNFLDNVKLEIYFYHDGFIFKYLTNITSKDALSNKVTFSEQKLFSKTYYKSYANEVYSDNGFVEYDKIYTLPEDTSIVFFPLEKKQVKCIYFSCDEMGKRTYDSVFKYLKTFKINESVLQSIIDIFDNNINSLSKLETDTYSLVYQNSERILSSNDLYHTLSSGTTKGMLLYIGVIISLKYGIDLIVDEIENHFHKSLVENILNLYKDKNVNKKNATLIFTTHYCEILDSFNRQDNIWISKCDKKVSLENMYIHYNERSDLLKSKKFYNNTFKTAVNYEALMKLKKELMI